eukprot:TRINITY_DN4639_c0_g1_i12.p1 TRINITY_DN4639_c0_g1~~TRINITY_DN4639_c0_g1_i12.p1  ORF type:complete len:258 (+),score=62.81 TRINITY_DN4639_c0_g1_i12:794-1567(+)
MKEKDFIISEQKKAENALAHQASVLHPDLEKSIQENALLFSKIAREDKLNAENRSVVDSFQSELSKQIIVLCDTVSTSMAKQNEHLQCVEKLCHSCLAFNDKSVLELRKKVASSKALYVSHLEAMQNVVRLHRASNNAQLEDITSLASDGSCFLEQLLDTESREANVIFGDIQGILSNHQGEMAIFARELHERFNASAEHTTTMSMFIVGLLDQLMEESCQLLAYASQAHEFQMDTIADFQRTYEERLRSETEERSM